MKDKWEREEPSKIVNPDVIISMDKGLVCILGLPGAGKTTLGKYFCWKTLQGAYTKKGLPIYVELRGIEKKERMYSPYENRVFLIYTITDIALMPRNDSLRHEE